MKVAIDYKTEDTERAFDTLCELLPLVATGELHFWNGTEPGGAVLEDVEDLRRALEGYDYIDLAQDGKNNNVTLAHHDGCHYMNFRALTKEGLDLYHAWVGGNDKETKEYTYKFFENERELIEHLHADYTK